VGVMGLTVCDGKAQWPITFGNSEGERGRSPHETVLLPDRSAFLTG
jgi:hypothetical protein